MIAFAYAFFLLVLASWIGLPFPLNIMFAVVVWTFTLVLGIKYEPGDNQL